MILNILYKKILFKLLKLNNKLYNLLNLKLNINK